MPDRITQAASDEDIQKYMQDKKDVRTSERISHRIGSLEVEKILLEVQVADYQEAVLLMNKQLEEERMKNQSLTEELEQIRQKRDPAETEDEAGRP